MKTIVLLLDGLGDIPHQSLEGKTPLEAAHTPHLDALCRQAETGMMVPWKLGVPMGTEVAHFVLLGYDINAFPGRGIVEALSRNVPLEKEGVYVATTWSTVAEDTWADHSCLSIRERWTSDLAEEEINKLQEALPAEIDGITFSWTRSSGPHGVLHLAGQGISAAISDSDPFRDPGHVLAIEAYDTVAGEAIHTAEAMNRFLLKTYEALKNHPINQQRETEGKGAANFLLTKWAARKPEIETFEDVNGMKGCIVAKKGLMSGIAQLVGLGFSPWETFEEGVASALALSHDFVWLHTKEPDEAAHTKVPQRKKEALEAIDEKLGPLVEAVHREDLLLVITGDHTTPSSGTMIHSGEPVPIMFIGRPVRVDDVTEFGERSCGKGNLMIKGTDLIPMILNFTERAQFYNFRPGGKKRRYIPEEYNLFNPGKIID